MKILRHCVFAVATLLLFGSDAIAKPSSASSSQPNASASNSASASAQSSTSTSSGATASFESQVLAYGEIGALATTVADNICPLIVPPGSNAPAKAPLIIYDQTTFANILAYTAFKQNTLAIKDAYRTLLPPPVAPKETSGTHGAAIAAAGPTPTFSFSFSPLSDLTGLVSMLAVSANSESYGSVVIPDSAIAIALTHTLPGKCKGVTIVYPPLFGQSSTTDTVGKELQTDIAAVNDARQAAHASVNKQIVGKATTTYPGATKAAAMADIDGLYDGLMNMLLQPNATTGAPGSVALVQGQKLASLIDDTDDIPAGSNPAYILLATVVASGGTARDHKTFWTNLTNGDEISYSGGLIVAITLWQGSSTPIYTEILRCRVPLNENPLHPNVAGECVSAL